VGGDEAVTGQRLAVGVGCRKGCEADAIVALVREALSRAGTPEAEPRLFTVADKREEAGLAHAAERLGLPLMFLGREALAASSEGCVTRSEKVQALFGVPSVAEAAALAGAGPGARLVVARIAAGGATCAVATPAGEAP
jgi:cobalt-precorrin 5A hydrolase